MLSNLKSRVVYLKYKSTLPLNPKHDDIYLVEFPKSGVTWLSFLLGNIERLYINVEEEITFFNYHKWVVDVHQLAYSPINRKLNLQRTFIKSHSEYNPNYYFVIYLMRDPLDVIVSYYNFMVDLDGYQGSFSDLVKDPKLGVLAWKKSVNSWIHGKVQAQSFHLIKYEDLLIDTKETLITLYKNLGIDLDVSILEKAIQLSSLKLMKDSEELYRSKNPSYTMNFIGSTNKKTKRELFDLDICNFIEQQIGDELSLFYPNSMNKLKRLLEKKI